MLADATVILRNCGDMGTIQIKVAPELVEKVRKKLNASPDMPAVYLVDQALRVFVEAKSA